MASSMAYFVWVLNKHIFSNKLDDEVNKKTLLSSCADNNYI